MTSEPSPTAAALAAFVADARASARRWGLAMVLTAVATSWLCAAWDPARLVGLAVWLVVGLFVVPVAFASALAAVAILLSALCAALSAPAWLRGHPTGLAALLVELWRLVGQVLPGYGRALRRVRRPWLWGTIAGVVAGVLVAGCTGGLAR